MGWRARRAKIAAQIDRELPGLTEGERRGVLEEQLREQAAARTEAIAPAPWSDRLTGLAARPLDGDTAGAVMV